MSLRRRRVAVCGAGCCDGPTAEVARQIGRLLAASGALLLCGGLGGVMAAACRGAHEAGGLTIGLLPGSDPNEANPDVDIPIATGMGQARNVVLVLAAETVIAVGGEAGTLSEIALALKVGRPVIGLGTWHLTRSDGAPESRIRYASTPEEAVRLAMASPPE